MWILLVFLFFIYWIFSAAILLGLAKKETRKLCLWRQVLAIILQIVFGFIILPYIVACVVGECISDLDNKEGVNDDQEMVSVRILRH